MTLKKGLLASLILVILLGGRAFAGSWDSIPHKFNITWGPEMVRDKTQEDETKVLVLKPVKEGTDMEAFAVLVTEAVDNERLSSPEFADSFYREMQKKKVLADEMTTFKGLPARKLIFTNSDDWIVGLVSFVSNGRTYFLLGLNDSPDMAPFMKVYNAQSALFNLGNLKPDPNPPDSPASTLDINTLK